MSTRQPLLDPVRATSPRGSSRPTAGGAGGGRPGGAAASDPRYATAVEAVQADLRKLDSTTAATWRAIEALGTARETRTSRADLQRLLGEGTALIKSASLSLRGLSDSKRSGDASERAHRQIQLQKLTKDLQDRMVAFQKVAQQAEAREKESARADRRTSSAARSSDEEDEAAARTRFQQFQRVDFNESIVAERNEAIRQIHGEVVEINELFRDIAVLVDDQGRDIDNIELNITESHAKTESGVQELQKAVEHQKKARGKVFCLLGVVLLIAAGVAVALVLKFKKK